LFKQILYLIQKEAELEFKSKTAIQGILLHVGSTIYIVYLSFKLNSSSFHPITWNALFWIIMVFTAVSAIAKSFIQESSSRYFYYYQLCSPEAIILSKLIYNTILMVVVSFISYFLYSIILDNPVENQLDFMVVFFLGAIGFSSVFTLVSSIASKTKNSAVLMAVLGFPLFLPMLMLLIRISKNAMDNVEISVTNLIILGAINIIVIATSYLLFPYLWRS
jgi:heme exporter protein B